jgi:hypothetical protein
VRNVEARRRSAGSHAKAEVATERKAREREPLVRVHQLQAAHRADHFVEAARVEDVAVQVVAVTVVTQVEPHDVKARVEQVLAKREQVQRPRTALPAMQQHGHALRGRASRLFLRRMVCEQPHTLAAVDEHFGGGAQQRRATTLDAAAPQRQARVDRLQVRVTQPARRGELAVRRGVIPPGHGATRDARKSCCRVLPAVMLIARE